MRARIPGVLAVLVVSAACGEPVPPPLPRVDFTITSLTPDKVDPATPTLLTLVTEHGCKVEDLSVAVGGIPVGDVVEATPDRYEFRSPISLVRGVSTVAVVVACRQPRDPAAAVYGRSSAQVSLTFDPALAPPPRVLTGSPSGAQASVRSVLTVTFEGDVDPGTIDETTVKVQGVAGRTRYVESTKTAVFEPASAFAFGRSYVAVVAGVRSRNGVALAPAGVNGSTDTAGERWTFTTRKAGDGSPWTRAVPAAGGETSSADGAIKLYSTTGDPGTSGVLGASGVQLRVGLVATSAPTAAP